MIFPPNVANLWIGTNLSTFGINLSTFGIAGRGRGAGVKGLVIFFFFITLTPRVE